MSTQNLQSKSLLRRPLLSIALVALVLAPMALTPVAAFAMPQWSPAMRVDPDAQLTSGYTSTFVAEDGAAMVVSVEGSGSVGLIQARRFAPATGWQDPVTVATANTSIPDCTFRAAGNRAGDILAAWLDWNGTAYIIRAAHYTAGWGWSLSAQLSTSANVTAACFNLAVAVDEGGEAIATWKTDDGATQDVRAARYLVGTGWSPEETVSPMTNNSGVDIAAGYDVFGVPIVVWSENNGTDESLYASRSSSVGTWSAAQLIFMHPDNGPGVVWTDWIRIAALPSGDLLLVWQVYNASTYGIWQVRYTQGAWETPWVVSNYGSSSTNPVLATSGDGSVLLAYRGSSRVATKMYADATGWSGSTNISGPASIAQLGIASNLAGQRVLVWQQNVGGLWHILAAEWSPWGGWSSVRTVDPGAVGSSGQWPLVGVDGRGDAVATWIYNNGTSWATWTSRFRWAEPNPLPLTVSSPRNRESVGTPSVVVAGLTAGGASVEVGGAHAVASADGRFAVTVPLREGWNFLTATAAGAQGQTARQHLWVAYTDPARARANETADGAVDGGWKLGHSVTGATRLNTIYNAPYGGQWYPGYSVSMGPGGDGAAFWMEANATIPYPFYVSAYLNGSGWQTPHLVTVEGNPPWSPFLVTDGEGRSTLVWQQGLEGKTSVWTVQYDPASGWGPVMDLAAGANAAIGARAAIGTTGEVFVTFEQDNGTNDDFVVRRYTPSGGWGPTVVLGAIGSANIAEQVVAVAGANTVLAAWTWRSGGVSNVSAYRFTPSTGWSAAATAVPDGNFIYALRGTLDTYGEATLVYRQTPPSSGTYDLMAVRSDSSNNWGTPVEIDGLTTNSPNTWRYGLGVDGRGDVTVMFLQHDGTSDRAFANRYIRGSGWTGSSTIDADADGKGWVTGGVSDDGTVVAAWHHWDGTSWRVEAARYIPGLGWQAPQWVTPEGDYQRDPWVVMTTGGRAMMIAFDWPDWPGSGWQDLIAYTFSPPDITPPSISISSPTHGSTTTSALAWVAGSTEPGARVFVNEVEALVSPLGTFGVWVALANGTNNISVAAFDEAGNTAGAGVTVYYDDPDRRRIEQLEAENAALQAELAATNATLQAAIAAGDAALLQELNDLNASLLTQLAAQNTALLGEIAALNGSLLAQLAAGDAALAQLIADTNTSLLAELAALDGGLTQAIAEMNASLLAEMAAQDAALAAQIAQTNATLFAELAALDASLLQALADQNASLLAQIALTNATLYAELAALDASLLQALADQNASLLAQIAAADQALLELIASTNATLLAELAAMDAALAAEIASVNSDLLAALAAQNDDLVEAIAMTNASLLALLAEQNATLWAKLTADNGALWEALNATAAQQRAEIEGTQSGLDTTNASLTDTQNELVVAQQSAASAGTMALIGVLVGAVGLAAAALGIMIGRRRPPMPPPERGGRLAPPTPGGAEEVEVDAVAPPAGGHGHSMGTELEVAGPLENDR